MLEFFEKLIKSSFIYGLGAVLSSFIGFFLLPVYTRFLTPSDYGIMETLGATTSILTTFLIFSMDSALFRFSFDSKDESQRKLVVGTTNAFLWCIAILAIIILGLNTGFISQLIFHNKDYIVFLNVSFVTVGVSLIYMIPRNIFRIYNQPVKYIVNSTILIILTAALCILFVVILKKGILGVLLGTLIATAVSTIQAFIMVRNLVSFKLSFKLLKKMLTYAIPLMPGGLLFWILNLSDTYLLLNYSSSAELGVYSVANKFASVVSLAIGSFTLAWPQAAFSILHQDNKNKIYARALSYFVLVSCSIVLVLSLFSRELVTLMTTPNFYNAAQVIPILSLALVFNGCYVIFTIGISVTKKTGMMFVITGIPAVINLILNYLLIPSYGMVAACWTDLGCFVLMAFLSWWTSERVYHIDYEWKSLGIILGLTIIFICVGTLFTFGHLYYSLPIRLFLIIAFFSLLIYLLKLPIKEGYRSIKQMLNLLRGKSN